jgi:NADH-quinone oxidoreductase subunit G/NADP-reducing hydrogenase subunit HndD
MLSIHINARAVEAEEGETILEAARRAGVEIPALCKVEGLTPTGACRVCVVELEGASALVPACSYPVALGMRVQTHSPRVLDARRTLVELMVSNHPDDCLYCQRQGTCELRTLANTVGVHRRVFQGEKRRRAADFTAAALERDPQKCILCSKCVRVCEEIQSVGAIDLVGRGAGTFVATAFDQGLANSSCVSCGQCVLACPTGALTERSHVQEVLAALANPELFVVVQHAPAVSVTLGELFGAAPGQDVDGQLVAALRQVGFERVFDTSFAADLTIWEEASELVKRIQSGLPLPMFTSCSPGWIRFVETFYPEFIPNLSTCKSPQQMLGALVKTYYAEREGLDPARIVSVSVMPCTAKKAEASRPEMRVSASADVDYVLTTRELAEVLRLHDIRLAEVVPDTADTPFGERTAAGKIFGASGGVMEAAVRSAHYFITGRELAELELLPLRGLAGAKELRARIGELEVGAAVVSGLGNARALLESLRAGRRDLHFIEVMTCPGGCINGGGQPYRSNAKAVRARMAALYSIDRSAARRTSHSNSEVQRLYQEYLGEPLGEQSHRLLHTHYAQHNVLF